MTLALRGISGSFNGLASKIAFIKKCYTKSLGDPRIRRFAEEAAGRGSRMTQTGNLYEALKKIMAYTQDPVGVEYTKSPSVMLDQWTRSSEHTIKGDCDDMSCLAYSMLQSIGIPAKLRVAWYGSSEMPSHIYVVAEPAGHAVAFDLTSKYGFAYEHPYRKVMDF